MIIQYQFFGNIQFKKLFNNLFFPENSIQKLIQKFYFGLTQFNKIFIQLENQSIAHHYWEHVVTERLELRSSLGSSSPHLVPAPPADCTSARIRYSHHPLDHISFFIDYHHNRLQSS